MLLLILIPVFLLSFISPPQSLAQACPQGDANSDCEVDGLDYVIWLNHYNQESAYGSVEGDFSNDGKTDGLDYIVWLNNVGKSSTPIPTTPSLTPVPTAITGNIYWQGNAETGNLSQWCHAHTVTPDRIQVVTGPVKQGKYAYRFELRDGDNIFGTERVVLSQGPEPCGHPLELNGQEKYYGWSVYLPSNFPVYTSWSQVMQFKAHDTGSPPLQLALNDNQWRLTYRPTASSSNLVKWSTPAVRGRWERFVAHVKWSTDPNVGFIEFWYNGTKVVPLFKTSTIHFLNGQPVPNHVAIGHYRDAAISSNVILYHDGFTVGSTYESVAQ